MKTYKYPFYDQSNTVRLGNLLDDMWQVHKYFHEWQRQRYKDDLPYANYNAMDAHFKVLKRTTHPHWHLLSSQAVQQELMRIDKAYDRFLGNSVVDRKSKSNISLNLSLTRVLRVGL